jgi:hypothetical protein
MVLPSLPRIPMAYFRLKAVAMIKSVRIRDFLAFVLATR